MRAVAKGLLGRTTAGAPPVFARFQLQDGRRLGSNHRLVTHFVGRLMGSRRIFLNRGDVQLRGKNAKQQNRKHDHGHKKHGKTKFGMAELRIVDEFHDGGLNAQKVLQGQLGREKSGLGSRKDTADQGWMGNKDEEKFLATQ